MPPRLAGGSRRCNGGSNSVNLLYKNINADLLGKLRIGIGITALPGRPEARRGQGAWVKEIHV